MQARMSRLPRRGDWERESEALHEPRIASVARFFTISFSGLDFRVGSRTKSWSRLVAGVRYAMVFERKGISLKLFLPLYMNVANAHISD